MKTNEIISREKCVLWECVYFKEFTYQMSHIRQRETQIPRAVTHKTTTTTIINSDIPTIDTQHMRSWLLLQQ